MMRRIATVIALLCGVVVQAHEIGTTRVSVQFQENRTYDIEVLTDAATLVDKLTAPSVSASTGTSPERLQLALFSLDEKFRRRLKIAFDAADVRPVIAYSVTQPRDASPVAAIRLTGQIPADARQFTWAYGWTFATYSMTVRGPVSGESKTEWLEGSQGSSPFALMSALRPAGRLATVWKYMVLGFTHIVPHGLDHMLFVLGIYLLNSRVRSVLVQVSAFTVAHSITLGLSMYGLVEVSPRIVEPLIALSIAYVAIENIFLSELKAWRVALVFGFGLLHGMGFAGALKELGLPGSEFLTALLTFNIGVEGGQLAVIGAAFLLVGWYAAGRVWYHSRIVIPASALIACTAVYWTIGRLSF